jgi:hypothetical protein
VQVQQRTQKVPWQHHQQRSGLEAFYNVTMARVLTRPSHSVPMCQWLAAELKQPIERKLAVLQKAACNCLKQPNCSNPAAGHGSRCANCCNSSGSGRQLVTAAEGGKGLRGRRGAAAVPGAAHCASTGCRSVAVAAAVWPILQVVSHHTSVTQRLK